MACQTTFIGKFVNVYLHDRAEGGPEEGGWYFDTYEAVSSVQVPNQDQSALMAARGIADNFCLENNKGRREISSVLSEGVYVVMIEAVPAHDQPETRPYYS
jgi:hypothetical protein